MNRPGDRTLRLKGLLSGAVPVAVMGAVLFASAGTLDWPMAWVVLAVMFAATALVTLLCSPGLIRERMQRQAGAKDWDARLVRALNLVGLLPLLVAGLDVRFSWMGGIPVPVQAAALCLFVAGYAVFSWAMLANPFFSLVVRIQGERDHHPITTGPYRFVRHPGYLGFFLVVLAQPLVLGSLWALVPAVITAALFIVRTGREDATLLAELGGYREYAQGVRYRLIPGVW